MGSREIFGAIAAAAAIAGVLFNGLWKEQDRQARELEQVEEKARAERSELRGQFQRELTTLNEGRLENAKAVTALQSAVVEIETQFRAMATANNLERQMQQTIGELLQQCGDKCTLPTRQYYPSGPGPNGKAGH